MAHNCQQMAAAQEQTNAVLLQMQRALQDQTSLAADASTQMATLVMNNHEHGTPPE